MENASKALLMAASVLVGLVILSLGIYLVNNIKSFSASYAKSVETYKNEQFNAQFTAFSGRKNISIHEIVTLANFADEFNKSNDVENTNKQYIDVIIKINNHITINLTDITKSPGLNQNYKDNKEKLIADLLDGTYIYRCR